MLKGILYAADPQKLEMIHSCMNQLYGHDILLNTIGHDRPISDSLIKENPDFILLDIQTVNQQVLDLCNHLIIRNTVIWLVAITTKHDNMPELHFFKWVNQHQSPEYRNLILGNHNLQNHASKKVKKIAVPTLEGFTFIESEEIIRFEAKGTYTSIFTCNGRKIISSKNIGEYEQHVHGLPFFRIHQSHLINLNKIQRYLKGRGGTVIMEDGTQIEVASRRRNDFINIFDHNS